jgi:leucyl-tRNA synthetase
MAVPGHDERDYAFAKTFGLPIVEVVAGGDLEREAFTGQGRSVNSGFLDGSETPEAKTRMGEWLEEQGLGKRTVTYKLRDWLFSRQRYWGEPFPVLHHEDESISLVPEEELPVTLPELEDFKPSGKGFESPLARVGDWIEFRDADGQRLRRDPNTMPQWAGSCWYFLRFVDPRNEERPWSEEAERYWMPVDLYVGGAEHAVLHLLYARFWHKVFYDLGLVHTKEPFQKLVNQGMILGTSYRYFDDNPSDDPEAEPRLYPASAVIADGERFVTREGGIEVKTRWVPLKDVVFPSDETARHPDHPEIVLEQVIEKMSKSRGNVINPDDVIAEFGADSMRLYEMFIGPLEKAAPWSTEGIQGIYRFLQRSWRLLMEELPDGGDRPRELADGDGTPEQARLTARTLHGVTEHLDEMRFNTAISKLMVFVRDIARDAPLPRKAAEAFTLALSPMAPHLAEELWKELGHSRTLAYEPWPTFDSALLVDEQITLVVQVNGKKRDEIAVAKDAPKETIEAAALACENVQRHLDGRAPKKVIVVPGRLVNIVG